MTDTEKAIQTAFLVAEPELLRLAKTCVDDGKHRGAKEIMMPFGGAPPDIAVYDVATATFVRIEACFVKNDALATPLFGTTVLTDHSNTETRIIPIPTKP